MTDYKEERLKQALDVAFDHLSDDDVLGAVSLTGLELTPDRRNITLFWVGPDGADEAAIERALDSVRFHLESEAEEVVRRRAKIRFVMDRGAVNQRRVEAILDELQGDDASAPDEGKSE